MIEHTQLLNEYASEAYSMYARTISEKEWGNKDAALEYLKKYHLPEDEYLEKWKPVQNMIFKNQDKSLPEMMFNKGFSLLAIRGGVLFEKEDFENLQSCVRQLGDEKLLIIQNDFGGKLNSTPLRMSYPSDITWEELMSGNFISTVIFEMFANEYFVFSESGKWGKYSANDYEQPLDIIGFKPDYESVFRKSFEQPPEEWEEIKEWLPPKYKEIIK
ncbi:MAG: hypothetical protein AAFX57_09185 [Bacteroidota bacterium]